MTSSVGIHLGLKGPEEGTRRPLTQKLGITTAVTLVLFRRSTGDRVVGVRHVPVTTTISVTVKYRAETNWGQRTCLNSTILTVRSPVFCKLTLGRWRRGLQQLLQLGQVVPQPQLLLADELPHVLQLLVREPAEQRRPQRVAPEGLGARAELHGPQQHAARGLAPPAAHFERQVAPPQRRAPAARRRVQRGLVQPPRAPHPSRERGHSVVVVTARPAAAAAAAAFASAAALAAAATAERRVARELERDRRGPQLQAGGVGAAQAGEHAPDGEAAVRREPPAHKGGEQRSVGGEGREPAREHLAQPGGRRGVGGGVAREQPAEVLEQRL
eukprot:scaffold24380_cov63-Phaeocystis_antarctica.AAC.7